MNIKKIFIFAFFIAYCLLLIFPTSSHAENLSLSVYPPIIQIKSEKPADISHPLEIENKGKLPVQIKVLIKPFEAKGEEGQIYFPDKLNKLQANFLKRVKILDEGREVETISLDPKQKRLLSLALNISKDEAETDYYFSVLFLTRTKLNTLANQSQNAIGMTTNVLLSVGKEDKSRIVVPEFSVPSFVEKGPVPFEVRLGNEGKHFGTPKGEIIIKNMFGQAVGRIRLQPVNVLSNSIRLIPARDQQQKADKGTSGLWAESFLFGPYTAELSIKDGNAEIRRTAFFFALPWKLLLGLFLSLLLFGYVARRVREKTR